MQSVTSNAVARAIGKTHYYHTTFTGTNENGWQTITIAFDVLYKYPPLVSVTTPAQAILHPYEYYWRETVSPFYVVTEGGITIAYYVRDSTSYTYDINVFGVLPD